MRPIRKILVPVDFSVDAQQALEIAMEMGRRFDATVTLLHVLQPPAHPVFPGLAVHEISDEEHGDGRAFQATTRLEQIRRDLVALGDPPALVELAEGEPATEILRVIDHGVVDLVIMGTHGRTGIRHALLGSVAENVVRRASCPVLTVHSDAARDLAPLPPG